jgi:hypothetical protein
MERVAVTAPATTNSSGMPHSCAKKTDAIMAWLGPGSLMGKSTAL